jgi:hypothetical protein
MDQDIASLAQRTGLSAAGCARIRQANENTHVHGFGRFGLVDWFRGKQISATQQAHENGELK